jgi:secondary thiamine-phosphate synthase enzyme
MVRTDSIHVETKGHTDVRNITDEVQRCVADSRLRAGQATVFVDGSTAGITTVEYEPGLVKDLKIAFEKLAPAGAPYHHHDTWGDDNGSAHVRAALLGPSLTVPFVDGRLKLGTWQQIVLIDFDTRPRERDLVVQMLGE